MKRNEKGSTGVNNEPLRLATVFSGIGAIEQALLRTQIGQGIVFACDDGDSTYGK